MAVTYSIDMADLNKLEAESKRKYGEGIGLSLEVGNETVSVTQDEKVLETHEQIKSFDRCVWNVCGRAEKPQADHEIPVQHRCSTGVLIAQSVSPRLVQEPFQESAAAMVRIRR